MFVLCAGTDRMPAKFCADVPQPQHDAAALYEDALIRGTGREVPLLHDLLLKVFTHKICDDGSTLPFYRFLVFYSFCRDGSLLLCNNITQIISRLVYLARATFWKATTQGVRPPDVSFDE